MSHALYRRYRAEYTLLCYIRVIVTLAMKIMRNKEKQKMDINFHLLNYISIMAYISM